MSGMLLKLNAEDQQVLETKIEKEQSIPNLMKQKKVLDGSPRHNVNSSVRSIWCSCFVPREPLKTAQESLSSPVNSQLLPSSAVQSMRKSNVSDHGDTDLSVPSSRPGCDLPVESHCYPRNNAELPSSMLFPNSLLVSSNQQTSFDAKSSHKMTKSLRAGWRGLKLVGHKLSVSRITNDAKNQTVIMSGESGQSVQNNVLANLPDETTIDETLVFSPLPSQKVQEVVSTPRHTTLLGPRSESDKGKKCFVIDLDETLVHSSFKMVEHADFKVGVEIDGITHRVYVLKRPHVDVFLSTMANLYECVLFTASLAKYADPVADFIDRWNTFRYRLFRESCVYHRGNYVKDLSHLGRPINQVVILDNSPASYMFHTSHAVQISSWFDDANDKALLDLIPYFERLASHPNVIDFLRNNTPPTPFAAVGTVGLPMSTFPAVVPATDLVGRTVDASGVISSIRRPTVASPLPNFASENRVTVRHGQSTLSEVQAHTDSRKIHGPSSASRLISTNALPVITKMAAPSSGPSLNPPHPTNDVAVSFPAPLSLATYLPIPSHSTAPVTAISPSTGISSQARVPSSSTNSHNLSGTVPFYPATRAAITSSSSSTSLRATNRIGTCSTTTHCSPTAPSMTKSFVSTRTRSTPLQIATSTHKHHSSAYVVPEQTSRVCTSAGENHCTTLPNASLRVESTRNSSPSSTTSRLN